jgi:hypothetical protein
MWSKYQAVKHFKRDKSFRKKHLIFLRLVGFGPKKLNSFYGNPGFNLIFNRL